MPIGLALAVVMSLARGVSADPLSPDRQREILRDALTAYDAAVAVAHSDPTEAERQYRVAAGGFQALCDAGLSNAALEYNLGNVHFRLGEFGRAILHYRRAERFASTDARLAANLRYARDHVEPLIAPSGQARLVHRLLFWHYSTLVRHRFWALVVCFAVGWPLLVAWLRWRRRPLAVVGLLGIALGLAAGLSAHWQLMDEVRRPHAVIVGEDVLLRLGRGEGSDLAIKQPLGPGVEVRIIEQRGDWLEIRLANDQAGWVPTEAVERV